MASCYHCGQNGSKYRRNVTTGSSHGTYYGKRSTSFNSRTYYGLRTLCEYCAFRHDKRKIISGIIGRWIIVAILSYIIVRYKI